jgi:hypothetical protein
MGLRFEAVLTLEPFEIFIFFRAFFVILVIFGAPRHGAVLASPKLVIAA